MSAGIKRLLSHADLVAAVAVVLVVVMMIVPLPPLAIDLFITLNISSAITIVVATLYVPRALDFAAFPSLLLLTTMFRLAINVSVTRQILLHGDGGQVVEAFGHFVVGGNVVVGLVVFLILIDDPVRRRHQRRRPGRRGRRPLHPRRDAGQADGDRRRPQRRPDQRPAGPPAARRHLPRGRLLRGDGRRLEIRQRRRDRRHPDRPDQPDRRDRRSGSCSRGSRSPKRPSTTRC